MDWNYVENLHKFCCWPFGLSLQGLPRRISFHCFPQVVWQRFSRRMPFLRHLCFLSGLWESAQLLFLILLVLYFTWFSGYLCQKKLLLPDNQQPNKKWRFTITIPIKKWMNGSHIRHPSINFPKGQGHMLEYITSIVN